MERRSGFLRLAACTHEHGIGVEASVGDGQRDANEVLHHDSPRAKIEVADFAVSHLSGGQADTETGGFEQRPGAAFPERIPGRRVGECDCVAVSFGAVAPSIENDERDWPRALCDGHYCNVIPPWREGVTSQNGNSKTERTGTRDTQARRACCRR